MFCVLIILCVVFLLSFYLHLLLLLLLQEDRCIKQTPSRSFSRFAFSLNPLQSANFQVHEEVRPLAAGASYLVIVVGDGWMEGWERMGRFFVGGGYD
jgi:hypothetical protein